MFDDFTCYILKICTIHECKKAKSVSGQTSKFTRKPCGVQEVQNQFRSWSVCACRHGPNHRVSSLHSDVSQRLNTQVRIGVPKPLRESMVQALLSHCAALYKCAWTFGSRNKQMEHR